MTWKHVILEMSPVAFLRSFVVESAMVPGLGGRGVKLILAMKLSNARICVLSDLLKLSRLAPCPPKIGDPDQLDKLLMLMLMSMLMLTI